MKQKLQSISIEDLENVVNSGADFRYSRAEITLLLQVKFSIIEFIGRNIIIKCGIFSL